MKSRKNRLEFAVLGSILLHTLLIGLFVLGSLFTQTTLPSAGGSGGTTDDFEAVMVDTGQVAAEYGRLIAEKQGNPPPKTELEEKNQTMEEEEIVEENAENEQAINLALQQEQERIEKEKQKQEELRLETIRQAELKKQREEATRKKEAEAARLRAEAEAKRLEAAAKKAEEERKAEEIRKQKEAQQKAEAERKKLEEQKKAERAAKEKAAKAKAEAEAKAKAAAKKAEAQRALDLLEGGNGSGGGTSRGGNRNVSGSQGSGGTKGVGQGNNSDGGVYGQRIKRLIQSKYRVDPSFAGKHCDVKIHLARDGQITNYQVVRGDKAVCDAAVSAIVATRKVPPAPSDAVYQQYKSPTLDFSLKIK